MAELTIYYKSQAVLKEKLDHSVLIGSGPDSDIRLIEGISEKHARLDVTPKGILVVDLGGSISTNGKNIEGSILLKDGDIFDIGAYRCHLLETSIRDKATPVNKTLTTSLIETSGTQSNIIPRLYILQPEKKSFRRVKLVMGRSPHCDLILNNPYASLEHCEIFFHQGRYFIRDLHSKNGVFINDTRITESELPATGIIRLGRVAVAYEIETLPTAESKEFEGVTVPGLRPGDPKRMIIGKSKIFRSLIEKLNKIAPRDDSVLLLGETGVGKDLFARYIHHNHPKRKNHPLIIVNCATIPQNLADSQLFGHIRGSFTGAVSDQKGFFLQADKGTLFLDEIGELPPESQAKLLRVLEDGLVRPVGDNKEHAVNVRLVFATNKNLEEEESFRKDLLYRFHHSIQIPPLRERRDDIPAIARYFISQHSPSPLKIESHIDKYLQNLPWDGNIRALDRSIRCAVTNCLSRGSDILQICDFETMTERHNDYRRHTSKRREYLVEVIKKQGGHLTRAAQALGISRVTLYKWMKRDGIDMEKLELE